MTIYMAFPVGVFWWFNQPSFFESWMMNERVSYRALQGPNKFICLLICSICKVTCNISYSVQTTHVTSKCLCLTHAKYFLKVFTGHHKHGLLCSQDFYIIMFFSLSRNNYFHHKTLDRYA